MTAMFSPVVRALAVSMLMASAFPLAANAENEIQDKMLPAPGLAPAEPASPAASPAPAASDDLSGICADRPTKSNNACTVDAGHLQYETDLFNGTFAREGGVTTDTYFATNPTFKYGISKEVDVEVNIAPYELVRTHDKFGDSSTIGGVGDLYLLLKYNFLNSADGKLSAAVIPYIKAPVARLGVGNGAWEGGAVMPISYKLTDLLTLTTQPEIDIFKNDLDSGRHVNTSQLIDLGYSFPNNVTIYGEVWGDWSFDPTGAAPQYSADVAASWNVTKYIQLDAGLNFGLNRNTPGVQTYFGISQKF